MRIVAGTHRGRTLKAPAGANTRPTADRTREAVFNVLAHGVAGPALAGARVADIFAGTGALGLEALSRGAAHCTFVESARAAQTLLTHNIAALDEGARATVLAQSATTLGPPPGGPVEIVFLDAPYGRGLSGPALAHLVDQGWFAPGAVAVVEVAADETLTAPPGLAVIKEKTYGAARVAFLISPPGTDPVP